ncbi:uncharacterized protein LOC116247448 [Nymphaea colorata]|nr:uncharacterized protein LOC116247448 [Nymphaea colorata]
MATLKALVVLLCVLAPYFASASIDGLLPNGDFEERPKSSLMRGTEVMGHDSIPHWETGGFVEYITSGQRQGDMLLLVPEGGHAVRLGNNAYIKHKMGAVKGQSYSITLTASRTCAQAEQLYVSVPPGHGILPIQTVYSSNGWDSYAWAFVAPSDEIEVIIHNPDSEDDKACGPIIDRVAMKQLAPPRARRGNLLKNGGFEEGPYYFSNSSEGVLIPPMADDDHSAVPGWAVKSLKSIRYIDSDHYTVPEGRRAVELLAGKEGVLVQQAKTVPGSLYVLSFMVGDANNECKGSMVVEAYAGSASTKVPYESSGRGGSKRAMLKFVAKSRLTNVVFFSSFYSTRSSDMSTLCGPVLDEVKLIRVRRKPRA